jgi:cytochrome oxidase Cu insertion factor (SCO1/SenC/PrrC family)
MRSVLIVAAIGLLASIVVGLLHPGSTPTGSSSKSTSSGAPVGLQVGDAAPNFTLSTLDGKQVSLSDFRGKPVMLNFWYTTCPGCLKETALGLQQDSNDPVYAHQGQNHHLVYHDRVYLIS